MKLLQRWILSKFILDIIKNLIWLINGLEKGSSGTIYIPTTDSIEFSENDTIFFGKVMGVRALISYEGITAKELIDDFHEAVDDYLLCCKNIMQKLPDVPQTHTPEVL